MRKGCRVWHSLPSPSASSFFGNEDRRNSLLPCIPLLFSTLQAINPLTDYYFQHIVNHSFLSLSFCFSDAVCNRGTDDSMQRERMREKRFSSNHNNKEYFSEAKFLMHTKGMQQQQQQHAFSFPLFPGD